MRAHDKIEPLSLGTWAGETGVTGFYHGWLVVAATAFALTLVLGATSNSFGLFVIPVTRDLGISRANMNSAIVIISVGHAIVTPFLGPLVARFGARLVLAVSSVSLGLGLVTLGVSHALWLSVLSLAILVPIGVDGTVRIPLMHMVAQWFRKYSTRAMALAALGFSLGGVLVPPVEAFALGTIGWRGTLIVTGVTLMVCLLAMALVLRERPGPRDIEPGPDPQGEATPGQDRPAGQSITVRELLRSPAFWLLTVGMSLLFGVTTAYLISFIPIAIGSGMTTAQATGLFSLASAFGVVTKLTLAKWGDQGSRSKMLIVLCMATTVMDLAFLISPNHATFVLCAILLGTVMGASIPLLQALIVDLFGSASFGTARGLIFPIEATCNAIAVRFAGEVYDRTGSYHVMFATFTVASLLSIVVVFALRRHTVVAAK